METTSTVVATTTLGSIKMAIMTMIVAITFRAHCVSVETDRNQRRKLCLFLPEHTFVLFSFHATSTFLIVQRPTLPSYWVPLHQATSPLVPFVSSPPFPPWSLCFSLQHPSHLGSIVSLAVLTPPSLVGSLPSPLAGPVEQTRVDSVSWQRRH